VQNPAIAEKEEQGMSVTAKQLRDTFQIVKDEMSSHGKEALEKALELEEGFILLPKSGMSETSRMLNSEVDIPTVILSLNDWKKLTGSDDNLPPFPIGPDTNFSPMLMVYLET
jgi:hypothetical protein